MPTKTKIKETIGFVGGGNMAKAICEGMVRKGNCFFLFLQNFYQNV
jgi:pyrroline-5-carboxylate reductase